MSWSPDSRSESERRLKEAFDRWDQQLSKRDLNSREFLADRAVARYCALASCGLQGAGQSPRSQLPKSESQWDALGKHADLLAGEPEGESRERELQRALLDRPRWEALALMLKNSRSRAACLEAHEWADFESARQLRSKYAWIEQYGAAERVFVNPLFAARFLLESPPAEGGSFSSGMTRMICADSGKSIRSKDGELFQWGQAVLAGIEKAELEASVEPASRARFGARL